MVAGSFSLEIESSVDEERIWNAMVKDSHNVLPRTAPDLCAGVTLLEGDGGVGTLRKINFASGYEEFSYVEHVDEVDDDNFVYKCSHVKGGIMRDKFASAQFVVSLSPREEGGCIATFTCHYESQPGIRHNDVKIEEMKENSIRMFKMIEAYLLNNPTLYS